MHHLGLATRDYDATVEFYTKVIGWEIAWQDLMQAPDGTVLVRHVFFDTGDGSYVAFMAPTPALPGTPENWATDINSGLGVPPHVYHFAFWLDSVEELEQFQRQIRERGVEASEVIDHDGWTAGFVVRDPNGLLIEFATTTRELTEDDKILKSRGAPRIPTHEQNPELRARDAGIIMNLPPEQAMALLSELEPKQAAE
jgi:catechol 2,3-dioxygenase-like lactoylglutathione lyase family enzyme